MTNKKSAEQPSELRLGSEGSPFVDQLRGLRECIAYIREDALAYGENGAAELLIAACHILDTSIERCDMFPSAHNFRH